MGRISGDACQVLRVLAISTFSQWSADIRVKSAKGKHWSDEKFEFEQNHLNHPVDVEGTSMRRAETVQGLISSDQGTHCDIESSNNDESQDQNEVGGTAKIQQGIAVEDLFCLRDLIACVLDEDAKIQLMKQLQDVARKIMSRR